MQIVLREKIQCVRGERTTEGNKTHESYGGKRLRGEIKGAHRAEGENKSTMEKMCKLKKITGDIKGHKIEGET